MCGKHLILGEGRGRAALKSQREPALGLPQFSTGEGVCVQGVRACVRVCVGLCECVWSVCGVCVWVWVCGGV